MHTIRGRLAVWYGLAMGATICVFAAIIYLVQRSQSYAELDSQVRLETDLIAAVLTEAYRARGTLVLTDSLTGNRMLAPDIADLLRGAPGFVVILLRGGDVLFVSASARALRVPALSQFFTVVQQPDTMGTFGVMNLSPAYGDVRYFVRPVNTAGPMITGVVAGIPTAGVELGPQRLLSAMLLIAPFILILSTVIGYALVGRTLKPVHNIVDEVEAISDGRSLHRRLAEPSTHDELGRLTTTLNQMLARLERSFMLLRRFTADASHELKTPLTVVRSGLDRAITHRDLPADVMEVLEEMLVETNRMTELVDSLLTLARVDEGRAPLHLDQVDLRELLTEVAETANILGEQAAVEVDVGVPEEPTLLWVDRSRMRQLLMNLLTNAIKYTPPGGQVSIGSATPNSQVAAP